VLRALQLAAWATRHHERLLLNVGVGYGGRQEIIDAVKGYLHESFVRRDRPDDILEGVTADSLAKHLYTYDCPDPDLIIRTSGEVRLSGFMLLAERLQRVLLLRRLIALRTPHDSRRIASG